MYKITVTTETSEKTQEFKEKMLLSDAMQQMGFIQNKPCGGKGICGKCKVIANNKEVLSCCTYVNEDTNIKYTSKSINLQGLTESVNTDFTKNPLIEQGYAMAVDIGTTTLAAYIYKFPECICINSSSLANTQAVHGADVISRIEYSNEGGLSELKNEIREQIEKLSGNFKIEKYVLTGNTTMLHLLTGKDPRGIAVAPFTPITLFGEWYENAYIPGCISSYVGADITTAILASNMLNDKTSFLVDIGTNGEMALWHEGNLICCSTAAGPAFEGNGISQGMLATDGAISEVYFENQQIKYKTIGNKNPEGICGTGLIDAIACMVESGDIDESGYLEKDFQIGNSNVSITPEDVRQVQLSKSAIRSGIDTLLHNFNIDVTDIDHFYIAGGFGNYINKKSAAAIGLIPEETIPVTSSIGNAAGNGACMILQSKECLEKSVEIAKTAKTIELSSDSYFMNKYIDNMMF